MARFVIDAQLSLHIAARLRSLGYDALHVAELGLAEAPDRVLADIAADRGAILVSKDADFAALREAGIARCPVLWIRVGNTTNDFLWQRMHLLLNDILSAFERGEPIVELHGKPIPLD